MTRRHDLSQLSWRLSGWTPYLWRLARSMETGAVSAAEILPNPARVPGSVQGALRDAGLIPDWEVGLQARECEWVENRHWIYEADLPDEWLAAGHDVRLHCLGLDYAGVVMVNGKEIAGFEGSLTPHTFDLTPHLAGSGNRLQIAFLCPPRWLGQFGYTSQMTEWKPRFNYTWDWVARLVQCGIWDGIHLEVTDGRELRDLRCRTDVDEAGGLLWVRGIAGGGDARACVSLAREGEVLRQQEVAAVELAAGVAWDGLPVERWFPNGHGAQPLYTVRVSLLDAEGVVQDEAERRVGFRAVEWRPCEGAPREADPWICVVNGLPLFLQGVNWSPIRPNFADVTDEQYRERLMLYRDLGCNLLRVWGGAALEKQLFYDLCDELGLLVWQELPLSSSGIDNWPPEDEGSIEDIERIARSYVARRQHHASLLLWCGGNELQGNLEGEKFGMGKPIDGTHPMMARVARVIAQEDPGRRFVPSSSSGPRFGASVEEFGKGLHWDVHGPWLMWGSLEEWEEYWRGDDALFRSETGSPGASGVDIIERYRGECEGLPCSHENPLWRRTAWWIEVPVFVAEHGREPEDLEEYVAWSQERQARALRIAAQACKGRFPRCGGFLVWMGHDCFPCASNTAIVDFWGRPKPAALALAEVFLSEAPGQE